MGFSRDRAFMKTRQNLNAFGLARFTSVILIFISMTISAAAAGMFPIATSTNLEFGFGNCAATDGTNYLVGYQINGSSVAVQLVSPSGSLSNSPVVINAGAVGAGPFVAFDGARYLMVWSTMPNDVLYGQFIDRSGATSGASFQIAQNAGGYVTVQALIFGGTNYLAATRDGNNNVDNVYGRLLSASTGAVQGAALPISTDTIGARNAALAYDGTNFLAVWQDHFTAANEQHFTWGRLVNPSGSLSNSFQISQTYSASFNPLALAFDGTNYLAIWNRDIGPGSPSPAVWDIYGRFVSAAGVPLGNELGIVTNSGNQVIPSLAFDGANYLLSWDDGSGTTVTDVKYAFIDTTGVQISSQFSVFAAQSTNYPYIGTVFFDGLRFLSVGVLSSLNSSNLKFASADVYGAFIPRSTQPPVLGVNGTLANGQFPLVVSGTPGISYAIQAAASLKASNISWTPLLTNSSASGTFNAVDTNAGAGPRFYRAVH